MTKEVLQQLLQANQHISCVCFMGGINDYSSLAALMQEVKNNNLKVAIYSGHDSINAEIEPFVDYYKIGHYDPELGPLNRKTTNQKFFKKENNK